MRLGLPSYASLSRSPRGSIDSNALPANGVLGARTRRWRAILPSARTLAWLVAIGAVAGYYQMLLSGERNAADRRIFALSRLNRSEKTKCSSDLDVTTTSCELCHHSPQHRMCEYGLDNIRLSRAYEGSGARLRKVLARGSQGHAINVGVLGASVTAGHGLAPGSPRWHEHFFSDFQKLFPNARMHVGAAGGVNSHVRRFSMRPLTDYILTPFPYSFSHTATKSSCHERRRSTCTS